MAAIAGVALASCGGGQPKINLSANEASIEKTETALNKKLPFERGSYVEESTTMGMVLTKTVYFDRWGDWTASEDKSEIEMMSYTHKTHKVNIIKGSTHWDIDMIEKTGRRYESVAFSSGMATALAASMGKQMTEDTEIKDLGEEEYLGYNCKKTSVK